MEPNEPINLRKCPFCGEKDAIKIDSYKDSGADWFFATCCECLAQGPVCGTKQGAIDTWNRREDNG